MIRWLVLALALVMVLFVVLDTDAMSKCQETYSFETCHATLNP